MSLSREEFDQIRQEAESAPSKSQKQLEREEIARLTEQFLEAGGQITYLPSHQRGENRFRGYNRELLSQQIDADEVAAMLGTQRAAVMTGARNRKLWGETFPAPLPKKGPGGRTMFKLPEVTKFLDKVKRQKGAA